MQPSSALGSEWVDDEQTVTVVKILPGKGTSETSGTLRYNICYSEKLVAVCSDTTFEPV